MSGLVDVRSIIAGTLDDVERIAQSQGMFGNVLSDLQAAQRVLFQRLHKEAARPGAVGLHDRFTGARADATLEHCRIVTEYVQERIGGRTKAQAEAAIAASLQRTVTTLEGLEQRFRGITPNLRLREAATLHRTAAAANGLWARSFPTSVDRYGAHMLGEFESIIRAGITSGSTMDEMIGALTGHGGPKGQVSLRAVVTPSGVLRTQEADIPEGLFVRHKYWAERLVRTELLRAYNVGRQAALEEQAKQFPDMQRKILAILDKRTAKDSLAVHGQIRGIREHFVDGAGRSYLHPPARPNDRETVIPWRDSWNASAANTSDWEKACMGESDQAGEDALFERMKALTSGKPPRAARKPKGAAAGEKVPAGPPPPPPLPAKLQKALDKLPPHFMHGTRDNFWEATEFGHHATDPDTGSRKPVKIKDEDLDELLLAGRVVKVDPLLYRVLDAAAAANLPQIPPMQIPAATTLAGKIEGKLRERIKVRPTAGSWGNVEIDGATVADIGKDSAGTFTVSTGWSLGNPRQIGSYPTHREALLEARAFAIQHAAEAAAATKEWDLDAFTDAARANDSTTARQMIRGLLWKNGVMPRDPFKNGAANANTLDVMSDAAMTARLPGAIAFHSNGTGKTAVRQTTWDEASGTRERQEHFVETMVHEELHGSSRTKGGAYQGAGATIEEASVEMAARKIAAGAFGTQPKNHWGAYQPEINNVAEAIMREIPLRSREGWWRAIADAGIKMRGVDSHAEIAGSVPDAIEQFVDALDLPTGYDGADVRKRLRANLKALRAPVI